MSDLEGAEMVNWKGVKVEEEEEDRGWFVWVNSRMAMVERWFAVPFESLNLASTWRGGLAIRFIAVNHSRGVVCYVPW
jgi:hypothetical protein